MRGDDDAVGADVESRRRTRRRSQGFEATAAPEKQHDDGQQNGAENHQNPRHHRLEDAAVIDGRKEGEEVGRER